MTRTTHTPTRSPIARRRAAAVAGATALAAAAWTFAAPAPAAAQCDPDAVFCAEVEVHGRAHAGIRVGRHRNPPRVIVVQPAPPPPPPPPAPRIVVVEAAPPPPPPREVVVVQHRTTRVVPAPPVGRPRPARYPAGDMGMKLYVGGSITPDAPMGGFGGALRFRPADHLGIDLGLGLWGGQDELGRWRGEVPITMDLRLVFNPRSRVQVHGILGGGVSFAHVEELDLSTRDLVHVGGQAGLGLEWFVASRFSIHLDAKAFLRQRVGGDDGGPEFVNAETGETTDTSAGGTLTGGIAWYW